MILKYVSRFFQYLGCPIVLYKQSTKVFVVDLFYVKKLSCLEVHAVWDKILKQFDEEDKEWSCSIERRITKSTGLFSMFKTYYDVIGKAFPNYVTMFEEHELIYIDDSPPVIFVNSSGIDLVSDSSFLYELMAVHFVDNTNVIRLLLYKIEGDRWQSASPLLNVALNRYSFLLQGQSLVPLWPDRYALMMTKKIQKALSKLTIIEALMGGQVRVFYNGDQKIQQGRYLDSMNRQYDIRLHISIKQEYIDEVIRLLLVALKDLFMEAQARCFIDDLYVNLDHKKSQTKIFTCQNELWGMVQHRLFIKKKRADNIQLDIVISFDILWILICMFSLNYDQKFSCWDKNLCVVYQHEKIYRSYDSIEDRDLHSIYFCNASSVQCKNQNICALVGLWDDIIFL